MLRAIAIIVGVILAAIGGVIAYRALFLEPSSAVIITNAEIRQIPNTFRVVGGIALLVTGGCLAFLAGRKRKI